MSPGPEPSSSENPGLEEGWEKGCCVFLLVKRYLFGKVQRGEEERKLF